MPESKVRGYHIWENRLVGDMISGKICLRARLGDMISGTTGW